MKVKISSLVEHEAELPDKCPCCGADFSETGNLLEGDWVPMEYEAAVVDGDVDCDVDSREEAESSFPVAYFRCKCGWALE